MPASSLKERLLSAFDATKKGAFILASCLIICIAVGNSVQWHLEQFWGASQAFFSDKWAYIYRVWGRENDMLMYIVGTAMAVAIPYVLGNAFFTFLDLTGKPSCLHKYKIQETKNVPVNWDKYKQCLKLVTVNSLITGPSFLALSWPFANMNFGYKLPTFPQVVLHLLFFVIIEEIGFYYIHRLLHHRYFYSRIHKIHHEWTAPVSIASIYCHPIEHFCGNVFPIMAGPLILGSYFNNHIVSAWLWGVLAVLNTTISHCGYHLPFLHSSEAHDFHHSKFNQNFGVLGILDRLHGTDNQFRKSVDYKRHFVLLGLSSAKELVPDDKKCSY